MQFTVLQENIRTALTLVAKAVPSRASLPILNSILLTADGMGIELAATDLYLGIKTSLPAVIDKPGKVAIPARVLLETIASMPAGKLTLSLQDTTLTIESDNVELKVPCLEGSEFPAFPEIAPELQSTSTELWQNIMQEVGFAVGTDPNRLLLSAVLLEPTEHGLNIVATDGFRLAVSHSESSVAGASQKLLIPARAIAEVVKIATQQKTEEVQLAVDESQKQLLFIAGSTSMVVRLVEGDFPPYQKIMPADFAVEATWDTALFAEHLKRALIFGRESSYVVKMSIDGDKLVLTSRGSTAGEYRGQLPVKLLKGEGGQIAFNARYVLDLLNNVKSDQLWFGMNDSLKPAVFRPAGKQNYTYVVMPFRTTD